MSTRETSRQFAVTVGAIVVVGLLWLLRDLLVLLGLSVVLAYALDPPAALLERVRIGRKRRLPRPVASGIVVFALALLAGWLLALGVPRLLSEIAQFAERVPSLSGEFLAAVQREAARYGLSASVDPIVNDLRTNTPALIRTLGGMLAGGIGRLFGGLGYLFGFVLVPLLAFYLLAERDDVRDSLLRFLPENAHDRMRQAERAVDRALRGYVRGQVLVCAFMGLTVGLAFTMMGYPYSLLLAVIVALAEVLPFVGAIVASAAILAAGIGGGPAYAAVGLAVYLVLNWAVGAFVTPRLMGHHLKMHAFVVTVSVLAGAALCGAAGAMLALPGAAAAQALVEEFGPAPRRKSPAGAAPAGPPDRAS